MNRSYFAQLTSLLVGSFALASTACSKESTEPAPTAPPAPESATAGPTSAQTAASKASFETTLRPVLREHCAACHGSSVRPLHSSPDVNTAYDAILSFHLVDFTNAKASRLYTRLGVDHHYCWNGDCTASAQTVLDAITKWIEGGAANSAPQGPARVAGPTLPVPANVTVGSPSDTTLNAKATELSFVMTTVAQGPVVFSVNVEKFDNYSYRLFAPKVSAPNGVKVTAKGLLFAVNDTVRPDGSFSLLDKTVEGQGATAPVVLDPATTLILLMDGGPGTDRIAPSFETFTAQ